MNNINYSFIINFVLFNLQSILIFNDCRFYVLTDFNKNGNQFCVIYFIQHNIFIKLRLMTNAL